MKQVKSKKRVQELAEVYTNEKEIINMLNLIPSDFETTFLEPSCGNGNFLIEIIKNKMKIKEEPEQILKKIYGIDICEENIKETKERIKKLLNLDNDKINKILNENIICGDFLKMEKIKEVDVIIGNPPYQQNDNGFGSSAKPIYNLFIKKSIELKPKYISFITPSRWLSGGKGLDKFREEMLKDKRLKKIIHFDNSKECFPDVNIEGGISYFLWEAVYEGFCNFIQIKKDEIISEESRDLNKYEVFIKDKIALDILEKIKAKEPKFFNEIILRPNFGVNTNFDNFVLEKREDDILLYTTKAKKAYVNKHNIKLNGNVGKYKVIVSEANGGALKNKMIISKPFLGLENSVCSQSYLFIPVDKKEEAENIIKYMKSRVFRFLLSLKKITQHAGVNTYSFIPIFENFEENKFYEYFKITKKEIEFINSKIEKME